MSLHVKPHHELQELLARLLFSIETVPTKEQRIMVNRACKEAVKWHKNQTNRMRLWVKDFERYLQLDGGICPECNCRIGEFSSHKYDCGLRAMLSDMKG